MVALDDKESPKMGDTPPPQDPDRPSSKFNPSPISDEPPPPNTCIPDSTSRPTRSITSILCSKLHYFRSVRFRMCLLLCGAMFIMQFMNMSLGMTIICMVRQNMSGPLETHAWNTTHEETPDIMPEQLVHLENITEAGGKYNWNPMIQGLVLSSLSWGRLLTPAAGLLVDRFNVKFLMTAGILLAGLSTALIPISSESSYALVILWRLVTGLADAIIQPSTNKLIPVWFPADERNMALSISTGGRQMAQIAVFPLAGFLCEKEEGGWPIVFYIGSALAAIWLPIWLYYANQNPQKHRRIGTSEKKKIESGTGGKIAGAAKRSTPWRRIFTSSALWANIGAVLCHELPLVIVFVFLPNYMRDVLHFETKDIGMFSGLPAAAFLATKLLSGQVSGCLQAGCKGKLSKNFIAKMFNTVASIGMGASLITVSFQSCWTRMLALVFIVTAISFAGLHTPGCMGSLVAIAPAYAGTISSIAFFLIGSAALVNPIAVKAMVPNGTYEEWRRVFQIAGSIALLPVVFFNIWGSVEEQEWAKPHKMMPPGGVGVSVESLSTICDSEDLEKGLNGPRNTKLGPLEAFRRKKFTD